METVEGKPRRVRPKALQVSASPAEHARIVASAKQARMSVSSYLRSSGLSKTVRSVLDHQAIATLARVNEDQSALRAALDRLMSERAAAMYARDIRDMLTRIDTLQAQLREIAGAVKT